MTEGSSAVVVLGSLHYDIMVEAPDRPRKGETLVGQGWRPTMGGKGRNQAAAAARAGAGTAMIGAVGRDGFGLALLASLDEAGVDRRHVLERSDAGSGMSVAITDPEGDYGAVIVSAANLTLGSAFVTERGGCIDTARVLVLQNEIPDAANVAAAARARRAGVLVVLNAAPAREPDPELPALVDILVVNAVEAEMLGGGSVDTLEDAQLAAGLLLDRYRAVVVTAGGGGTGLCGTGLGVGGDGGRSGAGPLDPWGRRRFRRHPGSAALRNLGSDPRARRRQCRGGGLGVARHRIGGSARTSTSWDRLPAFAAVFHPGSARGRPTCSRSPRERVFGNSWP